MGVIASGTILMLCSAFVATSAVAQESPSDVTDAQIDLLKTGVHTGCQKRGTERGDDSMEVAGFCACMSKKFDEIVTHADWQQLYWLEAHGRQQQEYELLAKYTPSIQACTGK